MIQTQPLEINDFSAGITDFYVNGPLNAIQKGDNVVVLTNKSLMMRPGSEIDDIAHDKIPAGNQRVGELINFNNNDTLLVQSSKNIYFRNPSSYATLLGPTGNSAFNLGSTSDPIANSQYRQQLFAVNNAYANAIKIFRDNTNTLRLVQAGLPALATSPVVTPGVVGTHNYLYAFTYEYEYNVGTELFINEGPVTELLVANSGDPSVNPNLITAIPVLANGGTGNYDTTAIHVFIYRTIDGGIVFFKIGQVTNGTTIFTDNFSDSTIQNNNVQLYTTGGVLENDPPPLAKYIHIVNNTAYYAYIKEGTEILKNQVRQSIQDAPDSVPASFTDEMQDEITGLSSIQSIPIVACKKFIYRLEGSFSDTGQGFINHIRISDTAGCISHRSMVQAENMLFWAGNDAFYMTDGYRVLKITEQLIDTYKNLVASTSDPTRIVGTFDEKERRVIWAIETDSGSLDNDSMVVLDLKWGISPTSVFTTFSGGNSFRPTTICFFKKKLHRGDTRGYVFRHDDAISTDPKVNTLLSAANWVRQTVIWDVKTVATNFGSAFMRKWVPRMLITLKNKSNISVQINAINDDGKLTRPLKQIRYRLNCIWGAPEFVWGALGFVWNTEGLIEQWRFLPANGLRVSYLQIQVTNAYTVITTSDDVGLATVDNILKTATLDGYPSVDWPLDSVDYFISFENDNYFKQYLITANSGGILTYSDTGNTSPSGDLKWEVEGYKKEEVLNLLQLTPHFSPLSKTQTTFETGDSGANSS